MKGENLMDAIGRLPEEMIEDAAKLRRKKRLRWQPLAGLAACLCLLLSLPLALGSMTAESKADGSLQESPMEAKPEANGSAMDHLFSDKAYGEVTGETERFLATVISVHSWGLLVEPLEDEWERSSADRIEVSFENLEKVPELSPGDLVRITYSGALQETYPAHAQDVTDIQRLG